MIRNTLLLLLFCLWIPVYGQDADTFEAAKNPGLKPGELLSDFEYVGNGDFHEGEKENTPWSTPKDWLLERSTGETKGYWETPGTTVLPYYLYLRRGVTRISQTDMRMVEAKPPLRDATYDGYSICPFPWTIWDQMHTPNLAPPIAVREGCASQVVNTPFSLKHSGAVLLRGQMWAPSPLPWISDLAPLRPAGFATIDLIIGDQSICAPIQEKIPIPLPTEKWTNFSVRLDWRTGEMENRIWLEWRFYDMAGHLLIPSNDGGKNSTIKSDEHGLVRYNIKEEPDQTPWTVCMVITKNSPLYQMLLNRDMMVQPRVVIGSWFAPESTCHFYQGTGETYFDHISLKEIRNEDTRR
jgi:hypothetical protein